jgi:hypothetical protein
MSISFSNVDFDEIVWGDIKEAIVAALNTMLGYDINARRLSKIATDMVTFLTRSQIGYRVDVSFEVEMEENQVTALNGEFTSNENAKVNFASVVVAKLQEISPSTYASVVIEVGETSVVSSPETATQPEVSSGGGSYVAVFVGLGAILLIVAGLAFVLHRRMNHGGATNKEEHGRWVEESAVPSPLQSVGHVTKSLSRHESQPMGLSQASRGNRGSHFTMTNPLAAAQRGKPTDEVAAL